MEQTFLKIIRSSYFYWFMFGFLYTLAFCLILFWAYSPAASAAEAVALDIADILETDYITVKDDLGVEKVITRSYYVDYTKEVPANEYEIIDARTAKSETYELPTGQKLMHYYFTDKYAGTNFEYEIKSQDMEIKDFETLIDRQVRNLLDLNIHYVNADNATSSVSHDTYMNSGSPTTNSGTAVYVDTIRDTRHSVWQTDLPADPGDTNITELYLSLYSPPAPYGPSPINSGDTFNIYKLTTEFDEGTATWNTPWTTAGGDYGDLLDGTTASTTIYTRKSFDIFDGGYDWTDTVALISRLDGNGSGSDVVWYSTEQGSNYAPYLEIYYEDATSTPPETPVATSSLALSDQADSDTIYEFIKIFIIIIIGFGVLTAMFKFWDFFIDFFTGRKNI